MKKKRTATKPGAPSVFADRPVGVQEEVDEILRSASRIHLRVGWWALLVFLTLGIFLETLHGFKIGWYLDVGNSTRRLMWTLAHAHGVLVSLIHIAFAFSLTLFQKWDGRGLAWASSGFNLAIILLPGGFLVGGIWTYGGDPGPGILLVPAGALSLFIAVLATARHASQRI